MVFWPPRYISEPCSATVQAALIGSLHLCAAKGKALAYAGVPDALSKQLNAGEWVKAPLAALGGKGGGKPTTAQGQGPNVDRVPEAIRAAEDFAMLKL